MYSNNYVCICECDNFKLAVKPLYVDMLKDRKQHISLIFHCVDIVRYPVISVREEFQRNFYLLVTVVSTYVCTVDSG